ncbi:MAG: hypothetical protein LBC85_03990 [Fibromonadaceae bacterium]|nr:hypothetical protein [Fibromonadaceae bacterium]
MPFLILLLLSSLAFAQVRAETEALTPFVSDLGTRLIAMPSYTYSRAPGTLGLAADEETWLPDKWRNRRIFNRFIPIMNWETEQSGLRFYVGCEQGDMLWRELSALGEEANRTPMLYGGFVTSPVNGFYALAKFNQIDHFTDATFDARRNRINSQKFSWFGENLPAYSGLWGGVGYNGKSDFFRNATVLTGSEYLWAWDEDEWKPVRISPRIESNLSLYFMETEVELHTATEKFQVQDSASENHSSWGLRLKGKNTGGGLYSSRKDNKESMIAWADFDHSLWGFTNSGFIAFNAFSSLRNQEIDPNDLYFADSLEYKININKSTSITPGLLFSRSGVKLYGETTYDFQPMLMKTRAYQNYNPDFESIGFDSEIAYKSRLSEFGAAYSREFFEYYRDDAFYSVKPAESSAKFFIKHRFLQHLVFTHEWVYRGEVLEPNLPARWIWNAQVEQYVPKLNTSLYAVWLHTTSKNEKDFHFGGVNRARFYCGVNTLF